jgi:hypothetical protein
MEGVVLGGQEGKRKYNIVLMRRIINTLQRDTGEACDNI